MLSALHLGGRNYTCTEIKLSKIILVSAPYPPPLVELWFQGNGSHLQAGVSLAVIALWLGHESVETTHIYVEADLTMKEQALQKLAPYDAPVSRFKADDPLLEFLASL